MAVMLATGQFKKCDALSSRMLHGGVCTSNRQPTLLTPLSYMWTCCRACVSLGAVQSMFTMPSTLSCLSTASTATAPAMRPLHYTVRYVKDGVMEWRVPRHWMHISQRVMTANLVRNAMEVPSPLHSHIVQTLHSLITLTSMPRSVDEEGGGSWWLGVLRSCGHLIGLVLL